MKKILTILLVTLMLLCVLSVTVFGATPQCQRQKVNVIGNATVNSETEDTDVTGFLANLTDGDKDTGVKSSTKDEKLTITFDFSSSGVSLEEVIITLISDTSAGVASGASGLGNKPFGTSLTVYVYPVDGEMSTYNFTPSATQKQVKVDLSSYDKRVKMVQIDVMCNNSANHPLWEVEANQYQGEHSWTLQSKTTPETCQTEGEGTYVCSCGASKTDVIPKAQHNYSVWKEDTSVTPPKHYKTCSTCTEIFFEGEHTYDNPCDAECNDCQRPRVVAPHTYKAACATVCEKCGGAQRTPPNPNHLYYQNAACDEYCDLCDEKRIAPASHDWKNACDAQCDVCMGTREVPDHVYTNNEPCDEYCDECNLKRVTTIGHIYTNGAACDTDCDKCKTVRETTVAHRYANRCDPTCNECSFKRTTEVDPEYISGHSYDNNCDPDCNYCKATRAVGHEYENACAAHCKICNHSRTPGEHIYQKKTLQVATQKSEGIENWVCSICGDKRTNIIPKLEKESNAPIIIAIVACVVVIGGCSGIALYSLVIKKKMEEKKRKIAEYLKQQEEARLAAEAAAAEAEEDEDDAPYAFTFGGSMYDDSAPADTSNAFAGIGSFSGIGIGDTSAPAEADEPADSDDTDEPTE